MYKVAKFLVNRSSESLSVMADGLGVILLTWNARVYLGGSINFDALQNCLEKNLKKIEVYRSRDITSLDSSDERDVKEIFEDFLKALASKQVTRSGTVEKFSPVSAAKALHILAPNFFPIWDNAIAKSYRCYWNSSEKGAGKYWQFILKIKRIVEGLSGEYEEIETISSESILKLIDEYNYSRFTKDWLHPGSVL